MDNREAIVTVDHLKAYFQVRKGFGRKLVIRAVDDVSFDIFRKETFGLVGESGCGKSTLGRTIVKINEPTGGKITVGGKDISALSGSELKKFRKNNQLIFQDPYTSLDPRMTVGEIIREPMKIHRIYPTKKAQDERISELLETVGLLPDHILRYPHEFSAGQRQKISIARTLALDPEFIVCDEPISSLDISVQAQIINLLKRIQREMGITYLFIAHDLSMVRYISDRIGVMCLGQIVELGESQKIYEKPLHPYTQSLLSAVPSPDFNAKPKGHTILRGELPDPLSPPSGCPFCSRCPYRMNRCAEERPELKEVSGRLIACHKAT